MLTLAAAADASVLQQQMAAQPFAIVRKPFDVEVLVETVLRCHDRARRTRAGADQADRAGR